MSRVGMSTINIPDGVTVTQDADKISAKGKNGELSVKTHEFINIKIDTAGNGIDSEIIKIRTIKTIIRVR